MAGMRAIDVTAIETAVFEACIEACYRLPDDVLRALVRAASTETSPAAKDILHLLIENAHVAAECDIALCQDTGMAVVLLEIGQSVSLVGGDLTVAINRGVARAYTEGYLRKSVVADPITRVNTGDNTPAVIHVDIVPGDELVVRVAAKGFGSENMSGLTMLTPADGTAGVRRFVAGLVRRAGGNPCPPLVVGVGLGGTMEKAATLAKKALFRPVGEPNPLPHLAQLERELLADIQATGVGPAGLGGLTSALAVHVEAYATHITSLPVAVNLSCHALRRATRVIQ